MSDLIIVTLEESMDVDLQVLLPFVTEEMTLLFDIGYVYNC